MNPVNACAGPHIERALRALVDAGFLAIVYGGADVGAHLANHPQVDTLHVTGSDRTYDAIVWGGDAAEQKRRKAANTPINKRPFTAELGCVTPVHGRARASGARATSRSRRATSRAWWRRTRASTATRPRWWSWPRAGRSSRRSSPRSARALARMPTRKAYYPGAESRYRAFLEAYPKAEVVGDERPKASCRGR